MSESIEQAGCQAGLRSQKSYADMRLQPAKGMTSLSTKELESVRKSDGIGKKFARRGQEKVLGAIHKGRPHGGGGFKNWSILRTNSTDRLREMRTRGRGGV